MLTGDEIEQIRRAYYCEHKSVRAIARDQRHHRRVVREAIAGASPGPRRYHRSKPTKRPVIDPVRSVIDAWLTADQTAPRKQQHSAKRVFDRLVAEHHFGGSERIVREYVHGWKQRQQHPQQEFLPLAYAPGAEAQCDWGEAVVRIDGREQTAAVFCLRLSYSLKPFVCVFPTARQECFFAGHVAAFAALGGVPHRIVYDNLSSAVRKVLRGRNRLEQDAFVAFRSPYLFESHFCPPGKEGAHEKPLVEALVGYARRNFLVPVPETPSWEALNVLLADRCAAEDQRPASGRAGTIGALWRDEQAALHPLPRHPYPCCQTVAVRATRQGLVTFERNRYSVPPQYGGLHLLVRASPWHLEITEGQTVVARHPRLYGTGQEQLDPLHYLDLLERKPGGFDLARPIQQWRADWPPIYQLYLDALRQERPEGATREFVRILRLHTRYAPEVLAAALEQAYHLTCWSADSVEQLARQLSSSPLPVTAVDLEAAPTLHLLAQVQIPVPDLHQFDRLLRESVR
jgi:transposase